MKAFISYSHRDAPALERLHTHLAVLRRDKLIESWFDRDILAGDDFSAVIAQRMDESELFLLLISPDFLNSNYCYDIEMTRALEKHVNGQARVVPIIVKPCDWTSTPLGRLKAIPKDGKPIAEWDNPDTAYLDVVQELRRIVQAEARQANPARASRIDLQGKDREVMVNGVVRRLSDVIIIAPPIPAEFDLRRSFHSTFGYRIEDFKKSGDFVDSGEPLWRHWSYPFMLGPIAIGDSTFDAIVRAPYRGLYLGRSWNGLGSLAHFKNRTGGAGQNRSFTILTFEGDSPRWTAEAYEHLIQAVECNFNRFQPKSKRGSKPSDFDRIFMEFRTAAPWIGDVHSCPFLASDDLQRVREAIVNANGQTMRR